MRQVQQLTYRSISQTLSAAGTHIIPSSTVYYWYKSYTEKGASHTYSNNRPRKATNYIVTNVNLELIEQCMQQNPEASSKDVQKTLERQTGTHISPCSIRRHRAKLGWTYKKTRYGQLVRDVNKVKRMEWCQQQLASKENFDNVIFTDEASFEIQRTANRMFYKKGQRVKLRPRPKHPLKVWYDSFVL